MKIGRITALLTFAAATALLGCQGEGDGGVDDEPLEQVTAEKPDDAMGNLRRAILAGDGEAFIANFQATPEQTEALKVIWKTVHVDHQYRTRMRAEYGRNALKDRGGAGELDKILNRKLLAGAKVPKDPNGDTVQARIKGRDRPLTLVREDGVWRVSADDLLPPDRPEQNRRYLRRLEAMAEVMAEALDKIGREGMNADLIRNEMHQQMALRLVEMTPADNP